MLSGDVGDSLAAVRVALQALKACFRRVFYCPGNHDLWIQQSSGEHERYPDSFSKLLGLLMMCDELQVETAPAIVAGGLSVVPLLSWYNHRFDIANPVPGRLRYDKFCRQVKEGATSGKVHTAPAGLVTLRHTCRSQLSQLNAPKIQMQAFIHEDV